ncbi:transposable element Tcb1 transposase [Trichonephila clavipes]|uniref:Transposable element Tcb1 transposase n=1 Tax=Trichonephila clavipes TaxID=2585209 RepID=A0A8X6T2H5_TRICX|nr:transposable element Tcb1 transposase [Trichonephila clavipes]
MKLSNHMCYHSCNGTQDPFLARQCWASRGKGVTRLSSHCYYPSLACPIPRFVSNQAYLGSFGTVNCVSHEFERTRGKVTANMERDVSRHHTELVCLNARSYRIMHSRQMGFNSILILRSFAFFSKI